MENKFNSFLVLGTRIPIILSCPAEPVCVIDSGSGQVDGSGPIIDKLC